MSQTKNSGEHFGGVVGEILAGPIDADPGCTRGRGKREGFANRKRREVDVVFWTIQDIATEMFLEVVGGDGVVVDVARNRVVLLAMIGERLQKRGAARPWASQDDYRWPGEQK